MIPEHPRFDALLDFYGVVRDVAHKPEAGSLDIAAIRSAYGRARLAEVPPKNLVDILQRLLPHDVRMKVYRR